MQTVWWKR